MSFPPDIKKAYGILSAVGARLGEKARTDPNVVPRLREPKDLEAFRATVRELVGTLLPEAILTTFLDQVVTPEEWEKWRARLLVQVKMTRDGAKPAPGHEAGKGVGRP